MTRLMSLAALVTSALVLFVAPAAPAAAANQGKTATAKVAKQVKKLKRQVAQLRQQVADAAKGPGPEGPQGPEGPGGPPGPATGPAGGDLTGTYPDPSIATNAIGTAEIADGDVTRPDIAANSIGAGAIRQDAIDSNHIVEQSVTQSDLAAKRVGAFQLGTPRAVVGGAVSVSAGTAATATVTCPGFGTAISGGFAWEDDEPNSIVYSAPSETSRQTWVVRGTVPSGSNRLFAWARCLD